MNIVVCVKQVLDTAAKIQLQGSRISVEGIPRILNPYDELAIEEAVRIKEKKQGTHVTVITLGPQKFREALRTGLAMGADDAIHIMDPTPENFDAFATASVLAKAIQSIPFELVLCGRQAVDDDLAQVGPALAVLLGIPGITMVTKLELAEDNKNAVVTRQIEGGTESIDSPLPVLLTSQKGLNKPRLPSLKGIMKAKKKEIQIKDVASLGIDISSLTPPRVEQVNLALPPERKKRRILEGSTQECASQLAQILRNDLKII